jgi:hypothetical protein
VWAKKRRRVVESRRPRSRTWVEEHLWVAARSSRGPLSHSRSSSHRAYVTSRSTDLRTCRPDRLAEIIHEPRKPGKVQPKSGRDFGRGWDRPFAIPGATPTEGDGWVRGPVEAGVPSNGYVFPFA